MKIQEALLYTIQQLFQHSDTPRLEAELLVALACKKSRGFLYCYPDQPLNDDELDSLKKFLERRLSKEPMAYILGSQEFWSLNFLVTPHTLIPRPETEHLVEWVLAHFSERQTLRVADLGTGCGAIAIALASQRPDWHIEGVDQSSDALKVAKENAARLNYPQITFYLGDFCHALPQTHCYDLIISNPPYIAADDPHLTELTHEPKEALIAEDEGLAAIKTIAKQAPKYLIASGCLVLEHGCNQSDSVKHILETAGFINIERHKDLAGLNRFVTAFLPK